jgi:hypothetical protein
MAITRNFTALILLMIAIVALAIGITIARAIVNHSVVVMTTSASASLKAPDVHYDL